jgi:hypothetical protein
MAYRMTPARKAALRKAQRVSARKRRGKGKGKLAAANRRATRNRNIALATGGLAGAAALAGYTGARYRVAKVETKRHREAPRTIGKNPKFGPYTQKRGSGRIFGFDSKKGYAAILIKRR